MTTATSRPEHLQQLYSAYERARPALAREIAAAFSERTGCRSLQGKHLVDIGCGNGEISDSFSRMGLKVTGVEYSSSRVMKMAAKSRNFRLIAGDGHHLPLRSRSFDFAVLADVLEHVYDPPQMMREVARVLKPGGLVFIGATNRCSIANLFTDPHYNAPFVPLMSKRLAAWYIVKFLKLSSSFNVEKYFRRTKLIRIIEDAGFSCNRLPFYGDKLAKVDLDPTTFGRRVVKNLLSVPSLRRSAVSLSSTWLFNTFIAPTFFFLAAKNEP
jgi:2-polyprenyl-3-methyl-5-hydroxy-6-metoxy-1,4-benzoquinol methylase